MKKLMIFAIAMMAVAIVIPSCKGNADENSVNQDSIDKVLLSDSLATIQAERDTLASLMAEVSDGMNQIVEMQNLMTGTNIAGESADQKTRLRNNVVAIQQAINERTQRVAELEKRLQKSSVYNDDLKKQVASMKLQLEKQQQMINNLTKQLEAANVEISTLNTRVDSLKTENTTVSANLTAERAKTAEQQEHITNLNNEMNTCYYVVGSKKELKKQKIIETGFLRKTKVMEGDYTQSYFTKADKRTLTQIQLHSQKAEVMSKHPSGSYVIEEAGGQKVLRITNPGNFWNLSNYLVVKID